MSLWLTVITVGMITFALRLSFIMLLKGADMPAALLSALRFVPPAVLMAIIVPELVIRQGQLALTLNNPRLLAGMIAAVVAWRTKNILLTISLGMLTLWTLQAIL